MTVHEDHDFGGPRDQCPYCMADLRAENARLQERVEEAETHMGEAWQEYRCLWLRWFEERVEKRYARQLVREMRRRGDHYKALAERRKQALVTAVYWRDRLANNAEDDEAYETLFLEDGCLDNEARAAIEEEGKESNG